MIISFIDINGWERFVRADQIESITRSSSVVPPVSVAVEQFKFGWLRTLSGQVYGFGDENYAATSFLEWSDWSMSNKC